MAFLPLAFLPLAFLPLAFLPLAFLPHTPQNSTGLTLVDVSLIDRLTKYVPYVT